MANEQLQAAVASNRDVPDGKAGPFQDCRDVVHIAVFFDGTGNNKDADEEKKKWSNVARMFFAAQAATEQSAATYPIYISGVGTPYNGKAVNWLDKREVWKEDNLKGMGFGGGGDRRLDQGADAVNDRLRDVLIENAKSMGGIVGKYAAESTTKSLSEVKTALDKHRLIKVINISVFGFSRGAALARAFANRVIEDCKVSGNDLLYQGYELRLSFMGVFDTVASFGLPSTNVQLPFMEKDLTVSPKIERCVHFVAGNEVRFSFPVDLIRKDGKLIGNWVEKTYPGVHSDVGGGYHPTDQGIDNNYARIPMRDMMKESLASGVRMLGYEDIRKNKFATFQKFFECKSETEIAYKNYIAASGPFTGTIESQMKQHQKALFSTYGTMDREGKETVGQRRRRENVWARIGVGDMAWEISKYRAAAKLDEWVRVSGYLHAYVQYVKPMQWQIAAWDAKASDAMVDFISTYVHDSKVDFISNLAEPFSYFKPRGVAESTKSIWQEGGNWINDKAHKVAASVGAGYKATKNEAANVANFTKAKAIEAENYTERKVKEGADYASKKTHEAELDARRLYDKGTHWVKSTKDEIVKETGQAIDATKQQAGKLYDKTADAIKSANDEVAKESSSLFNATKKLFGY
jgi:vacuolar-type H+-ATPase subunit H